MSSVNYVIVYCVLLVILLLVLLSLYEYSARCPTLLIDDSKSRIKMMAICQTYGLAAVPALAFIDSCHDVCKKLSRSHRHTWNDHISVQNRHMSCELVVDCTNIGIPVVEMSKSITNTVTVVYALRVPKQQCIMKCKYRAVACDPQLHLIDHDNYAISCLMRIARWYGVEVDGMTYRNYMIEARACDCEHDYIQTETCKCKGHTLDIWCGYVQDHCMHVIS